MATRIKKQGDVRFISHDGRAYVDKLKTRRQMMSKYRKLVRVHNALIKEYPNSQYMRLFHIRMRARMQRRVVEWALIS